MEIRDHKEFEGPEKFRNTKEIRNIEAWPNTWVLRWGGAQPGAQPTIFKF